MRRLSSLLALTALSACNLAPAYHRAELPVPPSWPVGDAYLRQSEATLPALTYRDVFRDARLQQVIARALVNNRDLRAAAANIQAAGAQYRIQRASLLPQIDATGRYSYQGGGRGTSNLAGGGNGGGTTPGSGGGTTPGSGGGTTPGTGTGGTGGGIVTSGQGSSWSVGLGVTSFEIDLFGRLRSLTSAALDRYFESEAAARSTRLTIVGNVASTWFQLAADRSLLAIAQETARSAQDTVRLTDARRAGGVAPRTDLTQAQQILETANANVALQTTLVAQDGNLLQLLVGAPIEGALLPASLDEVAESVANLPAGLDSSILLRRPDVVEAEYELRATNAEIGAARAALFPRLTLTGLLGFASTGLSSLFTSDAFNYSVAPNVSYPIFRAGAGIAGVRYSQAQRDAALANYERAIQSAFRDTADALARQGTIAAQLGASRRFVAAASTTLRLADASYRGGVSPFLDTLDAQRSLYSAQQTLVNTQLTALSNRVTVYQAIGGDSTLEATANGPLPVHTQGQPRSDQPVPPRP